MATFNVNNTNDSGAGSLRDAIEQANTVAGADSIVFDANFFSTARTIRLGSQLLINDSLSIIGAGQNLLTISGDANNNGINDDGDVRLFFVNQGTVNFSGLTLQNGHGKGGNGGNGGQFNGGGGGGLGAGGALFINTGTVTVSKIVFSNNQSVGGNGGNSTATGFGGGGGFGGDGGNGGSNFSGGGGGGFVGRGADGNASGGGGGGGSAGNGIGNNGGIGNVSIFSGSTAGNGSVGIGGGIGGGGGGSNNTGIFGGNGAIGGGGGGGQGIGGSGTNGGNGGDFGGGGGVWVASQPSSGTGGWGGGGGAHYRGQGGFGGGGASNGSGGQFGGFAGTGTSTGGGAGLGGAIFIRNGALSLIDSIFNGNSATGGLAFGDGQNGQAKGGAIFVNTGSTVSGSGLTFTGNKAGNSVIQSQGGIGTKLDTDAVYGTVISANQAPTGLSLSTSSINENVAANSVVGTFSSTDPDTGNSFTYSLVPGTGDTGNSAFSIVGNELRINNSPNFESQASYNIRVRTTDQGGLFYDKELTVNVNNLNEAPTALNLSASSINENVAANSVVGIFNSIAPDTGNTFSYSLATGNGDTDNSAFSIVGNELQLNISPNYEAKSSYNIRVRTTDQGGEFLEQSLAINVNNVLENMDGNDILSAPDDLSLVFNAAQRAQFLGNAGTELAAFSENFYLSQYSDVAAAVSAGIFQNGFDHFSQFGQSEGRLANGNSAIFDEGYYLFHNPDVAAAVSGGVFRSGFAHFQEFGQFEGRNPSVLYDESFYLSQNSDVADAVAGGIFKSGFQHFTQFGGKEGRDPSPSFSNSVYLSENPDVAAAVSAGAFGSGFAHFIQFGGKEGREDNLLFNERYYLSQNSDVASAVASGAFKSGFDHFIQFGAKEGRAPSELYNESDYLAQYADVAAAISGGAFASGFDHFIQFGEKEGRFTVAPVSLDGGDGDDILYGGAGGRVVMTGGQGSDRFWVADQVMPRNANTVTDFEVGVDAIVINALPGVTGIGDLNITQQGADTSVSALGKELATLVGVQATNLNSNSFIFAASPVV